MVWDQAARVAGARGRGKGRASSAARGGSAGRGRAIRLAGPWHRPPAVAAGPEFRGRAPSSAPPLFLAGPLKPSLATSPALQILDLSNNQITGDLSAFASALERASSNGIVALNASNNRISGAVPDGLARLAVFDPQPVKSARG